MTKKNIFVVVAVVLLAGLSLYLNRGRFQSEPVRIGSRSMQPRAAGLRRGAKDPANSVVFLINRPLKLTSVKVVPVNDIQTNKYALPVWELVSQTRSIPVKDFIYGANIKGMQPSVKGAVADPLQPGVPYRLLVEAGDVKVEHDFTPTPRTP
jgi:hypothetical protein